VVAINRVTKVVKGGKIFRSPRWWWAIRRRQWWVTGGKAKEVPQAIRKR